MQDRVPTYPGRVILTPVAGQANTYDMVRADDPTQEGTPLNKASLLKDETAALLGMDDMAVPDDALNALAQGDIMIPNGIVIEKITTSMAWTAPAAKGNVFWVYIIGGGGGGPGYSNQYGGGGGSGHIAYGKLTIAAGTAIQIVLGAGGTAGGASQPTVANAGGASSFGTFLTAAGGSPGVYGGAGGNGGAGGGGYNGGKAGNGSFGGGGGYGYPSNSTGSPGTNFGQGGPFGGNGYGGTPAQGTRVTTFPFPLLLIAMLEGVTPQYTGRYLGGNGGYGGDGGSGTGAGGGGYGAPGGDSAYTQQQPFGCGGGGLFGPGGSNQGGCCGGGGGLFGPGGAKDAPPSNGGGGAGYGQAGADGVCYIVYRRDMDNAV